MRKKAFSIVFVPHSKAGSKTITVSKRALKITFGVAVACVLLLGGFLADYFTMGHARSSYKRLLKASEGQRQELKEYQTSVEKLKKTVESLDQYVKKLNVMAGLKANGIKEVGIGDSSQDPIVPPQIPITPRFSVDTIRDINQKADDLSKNMSTLVIFFENRNAQLASTPTIIPTIGWITSVFGVRNDPFTERPTFHYGLDIATNEGNPIVAPAAGIVVQLKHEATTGNSILISHGLDITTAYFHLSKFLVHEGQRVKRGDVIGLVGRTGKALGPHLHYEVHVNGVPVNPLGYILDGND